MEREGRAVEAVAENREGRKRNGIFFWKSRLLESAVGLAIPLECQIWIEIESILLDNKL